MKTSNKIVQVESRTTDIVILCVSGPVRKWLNEAHIFGSNRSEITTDLQQIQAQSRQQIRLLLS